MKTIYRAFFADNGCSLITIVSNRLEKHRLSQTAQDVLTSDKLWTAKITHCVNVVEAPQAGRLVATDTSGRHFGLCSMTGDILWTSGRLGEGDPAVVVEHAAEDGGPNEVFVFATWKGMLHRLDPKTGQEAEKPVDLRSKLRDLHLTSDGQRLFVTRLVPAISDTDPVGRTLNLLDLKTNTTKVVAPNTFTCRNIVCPAGQKTLFVYITDPPSGLMSDRSERWEVKDIATGSLLAARTFAPREFFSPNAVWSPDGKSIATTKRDGHLIFDAETLETKASVPAQRAERPAFHPSGSHICLCQANKTKIVPMNMLQLTH